MKFAIQTGAYNAKNYDCLIVGVYENGALTPSAKKLDKESQNYLSKLLKNGDFQGKTGQTHVLYHVPKQNFERVLIVGCGKESALNERDYRKIIFSCIKALMASKAAHALSCLTDLDVKNHDTAWKIKQAIEVSSDALYSFDQYKSEKAPKIPLQSITQHLTDSKQAKNAEHALKQGIAIASGVEYTKNLANQPSNVCTPSFLAEKAKKLAKEYKNIKVKILEKSEMEKLGMGALLAVAKGSAQPPKLITIEYHGTAKKKAPIALVGKGVTFDTGGVSLKPADAMVGMKYDMCGAATVLGTIKAAAELKLPLHIVGVIPTVENMPSGTAYKPEDIVTTLSGQTVEVMNTDAEGRLILCDALTYCERYKPEAVIDIATLTGAVVIALGFHVSALLSNHDPLAKDLLAASNESFDRAWQMPLWDEYQEQLKSPFADMSNTGGRSAGTITAACFLSRFTKKFHWAHLDVAGTAAMMAGTNDRYSTGRPVPLLMHYLINKV